MIRVGGDGGWVSIVKTPRGWWPLLAVTVLLVLAGGAAAVASPQLTRIPIPNHTQRAGAPYDGPTPVERSIGPAQGGPVTRPDIPSWLAPLLGGVLLAVLLGGLLTALWLVSRGRLGSRPGKIEDPVVASRTAAEQVVAAVDAGLSDLSDADVDPRRAVIACWVRLEQVAAAAGTPRQIADTPSDLVTRLLEGHGARGRSELASPASPSEGFGVDPAVLAEFADVYRRARFTTHTVDERMRGQARTALERVRSELAGVGPAQGLVRG